MLRNISSNVLGTVLPSLSALVAVPLLIGKLGMGGFGIFSMQVAALFFFGLADLGISRAIVLLSFEERFARAGGWRRPYQMGVRFSALLCAGVALLGFPAAGALLVWHPAGTSGPDLALSTLLVFLSAGITLLMQAPRAVLETQERFVGANAIRGPAAAAVFLAPLAALEIHNSLTSAAISLVPTRALAAGAYFWACGHFSDRQLRDPLPASERAELRALFLAKAGWLGATNLLSMLLAYLDRFLLGALGSSVLVGQYVVSQEVVTKAWISAGAIMSAATPRLAASMGGKAGATQAVVRQMFQWMLLGGVLPALVLVAFGGPLLQLWLGKNFSPASVLPLQLMAIGLGANTISQINFSLLQVRGGVREGAYLQVFNLAVLLVGLLLTVPRWGVLGAAATFSLRLLLDAFVVRWLLVRNNIGGQPLGIRAATIAGIAVLLAGCLAIQRLLS
ncbi:MAG: oligosaccharide flippase family protein [Ramlibacter sp.]